MWYNILKRFASCLCSAGFGLGLFTTTSCLLGCIIMACCLWCKDCNRRRLLFWFFSAGYLCLSKEFVQDTVNRQVDLKLGINNPDTLRTSQASRKKRSSTTTCSNPSYLMQEDAQSTVSEMSTIATASTSVTASTSSSVTPSTSTVEVHQEDKRIRRPTLEELIMGYKPDSVVPSASHDRWLARNKRAEEAASKLDNYFQDRADRVEKARLRMAAWNPDW